MTDVSLSTGMLSLFYLRRVHHSTFLYTAIRTTSSEVAAPENDSNMADDSDPFAMTLVDSINASNTDTLPQADDSDMDVSQDDSGNDLNPGRRSKETAKSSRIRKNLAISKSRRDLHRGRRVPPRPRTPSPSPSSSSDSDSDGSATQHGNDTASPPRNPVTPAKHHRSSSPKLGSMENPIDVDSIASLFEPMAIKEYVRLSFFFPFALLILNICYS